MSVTQEASTSGPTEQHLSRNNSSILPERYDGQSDFRQLRHFDSCAEANNWSNDDKLRRLPAFLRGRASTYFYALTADEKADYATMTKSLQGSLCPPAEREKNYRLFESRCLRPGEDPAVFRWELEEILRVAEPTLTTDQMETLIARQFMRGLPQGLQIKLLENDPVPSLEKMVSFSRNMRAIQQNIESVPGVAAVSREDDRILKLTALVEELASNQRDLRATIERTQQRNPAQRRNTGECFNCGRRGHFARDCQSPARRQENIECFNCHQFGHQARYCRNLNANRAAQK